MHDSPLCIRTISICQSMFREHSRTADSSAPGPCGRMFRTPSGAHTRSISKNIERSCLLIMQVHCRAAGWYGLPTGPRSRSPPPDDDAAEAARRNRRAAISRAISMSRDWRDLAALVNQAGQELEAPHLAHMTTRLEQLLSGQRISSSEAQQVRFCGPRSCSSSIGQLANSLIVLRQQYELRSYVSSS